MTRIERLESIANEVGVEVIIKQIGSDIFANINGQSFKVRGFASFQSKCKELKNYVAPYPIDLTSRLEAIERGALSLLSK